MKRVKKQTPYLVKGPPATVEDVIRIFKISPERVAALNAIVESIPGLRDSNEEILKRAKSVPVEV